MHGKKQSLTLVEGAVSYSATIYISIYTGTLT